MRRRAFVAGLGAATAWTFGTGAQVPSNLKTILWVSTEAQPDPFITSFREAMRDRGYVEGQNIAFALQYAPGDPSALRARLPAIIGTPADLIVSADHHRIEDGARDHFQHSKPASTHSDPCSAGSDRARGAFVPGKGIWPLGLMSQASRRYYFTSASYTNKVDLSSSGMKYARRPESPASTQTGFCVIGRPDGDHSSTGT